MYKFIVELLYGAGNKAAAALHPITYIPRTEGQAFSDQLLARAGTCAHLVSTFAHLLDFSP